MTDWPESVREYERRRGEGLCWHERQLLPITDAAIRDLKAELAAARHEVRRQGDLLDGLGIDMRKLADDLGDAPTVRCEECRYSPPPQVGAGGARRYCHDCFCGSYFKRRTP